MRSDSRTRIRLPSHHYEDRHPIACRADVHDQSRTPPRAGLELQLRHVIHSRREHQIAIRIGSRCRRRDEGGDPTVGGQNRLLNYDVRRPQLSWCIGSSYHAVRANLPAPAPPPIQYPYPRPHLTSLGPAQSRSTRLNSPEPRSPLLVRFKVDPLLPLSHPLPFQSQSSRSTPSLSAQNPSRRHCL